MATMWNVNTDKMRRSGGTRARTRLGLSNLLMAMFFLCGVSVAEVDAQISVTKMGEHLIGSNAQPLNVSDPLNLRSHIDDGIVSFNGYQYAVYWSLVGTDLTKRYVSIGRRKLPDGAWETAQLTDYKQTINDSHRVVSMGICEADGTIHMSFDHHNNNIHYRISVPGLATEPESHTWTANKFGATTEFLPGLTWEDTKGCTYPRFTHKPNGDLILIRRKGSAINGLSFIYSYSANTQLWVKHGIYIDGSKVLYGDDETLPDLDRKLNAYLHGVNYDDNGRLHVSWVWRTLNGINFDLMYAYSDDDGIHWYNNEGQLAGSTSNPMTYKNTPAVKVRTYAEGILYNQTGQTVDSAGRVHAVQRKNGKFMHLYRDTDGEWIENTTALPQGRYKLTVDQNDNLYYITSGSRVYAATPANDYKDWTNVYNGELSRFSGDPAFDEYRMKTEGILSIMVGRSGGSKEMYSVDLNVSPVISTPPIPQDTTAQAWNEASTWDPDGVPASSNDYTSALHLFSPGTSSTFGGKSLTMLTNGVLHLKNSNGNVATVPDLMMNGGSIVASQGVKSIPVLSGNLAIKSDAIIQDNLTDGVRNIRIESRISGAASIISTAVAVDSAHELQIINPANSFSGTWISRRGSLVFEDPSAVGSGNIIVEDRGGLTIQGDWNQSDAHLTVADSTFAQVDLGSNTWTIAALTVGTTVVADGIYTATVLNGMGSAVFSGSGLITVGEAVIWQDITQKDWKEATAWNPDGVPVAGYDYISALHLYAPITGTTFGGDTLTMVTNGVLHVKNINTYIATVPDLIMDGGSIIANRGVNTTNTLAGKLTIQQDTSIKDNLTNGVRNIRIASQIIGSAAIISTATALDSAHQLQIINPANTFSGNWISRHGTLVFENAGAIGTGNIIVEENGGLSIQGNWSKPDTQLTVADSATAHIDLGSYTWTLSVLTLGLTDVANGTYNAAALNGMGAAQFSGSGTITVGSEVIWQDTELQAWNIPSTWNPDGAAVAGSDYATALRLRTLTTSGTFSGDSLTVYPLGQLQMRHIGLAKISTVPNLILAGGKVYAGTGNNVISVLNGNITVLEDSRLEGHWSGTVYRSLRILSRIEGSANLTNTTSQAGSTHELQIVNAANTFSGTWVGHTGTLIFENSGAVGVGDIVLLNEGKLSIQGNWNQATNGATLTVADSVTAQVNIGTYQWEVAALQIGSNVLADGTYTAAALNAEGLAVFVGTGTIKVSSLDVQPPSLVVDVDASSGIFSFSWSDDSFKLQMLTNDLSSNLWFDYPNGATSPVNHTVEPDDAPGAFFRLIKP